LFLDPSGADHYACSVAQSTGGSSGLERLIEVAAERLSERAEGPIQLRLEQTLSAPERRNLVLRCSFDRAQFDRPQGGRSSVIIKQAARGYAPEDASHWDTRRLFNEWAGTAFLSTLPGEAHAPRFLAGDRALGFVVLEDLGQPHWSLVQPLLEGSAADAEHALRLYVRRLGRMHGSSMTLLPHHEALIAALRGSLDASKPALAWAIGSVESIADVLEPQGLMTTELSRALLAAAEAADAAGPFRAFIHGDPCPDNVFLKGDDLLLIDFELARLGSALLDAVYVLAPFPTCSCANRVPDSLVPALLDVYRTELSPFCPAALDDGAFERALLDAAGSSLVSRLGSLLPKCWKEDETWGIAGLRSRVLTGLERYVALSTRLSGESSLSGEVERLFAALKARWPGVELLPVYPAFRA
jgi:phosphotransferase family enzyme